MYTEETRYSDIWLLWQHREDVAGNAAALLALSYNVTQHGSTVYELSIQEQQQRQAQTQMLLGYLAYQAGYGLVYGSSGVIYNPNGLDAIEFTGVDPRGMNGSYIPPGVTPQIPDKVYDIVNNILTRNGTPPQGYIGGRTYKNIPLEEGTLKLPEGIGNKKYDVNPYVPGQNRGAERIVIGDDGSVWYTNDHYYSFTRID